MKIIDAGTSVISSNSVQKKWSDLHLSRDYKKIVEILNPNSTPRPIQVLAFGKNNILENRRNLIVSAPTNGGKSLVATLLLFDSVRQGRRAILLEPLRALAREKFEELTQILPQIERIMKRKVTVRITTGDYRLDSEYFHSPPPDSGEIIIATPERLEAILRNPDNETWVRSVGLICFDEAHLISSEKRGPVFEYLITSFLCHPVSPRLVLLSGSLGSTEKARTWLAPCDELKITERFPRLRKRVLEITENDDLTAEVQKLAGEILDDPAASLLIFVYQTKSAEKLAGELRGTLGELTGCDGALAFHSQMSSQKKEKVRESFAKNRSRCIVATTSLALGVNLPCTHVIVRDLTFAREGALTVPEILQMLGRAGRGNQIGHADVIVRLTDRVVAEDLARELKDEPLPELCSSFESVEKRKPASNCLSLAAATQVAIQIARSGEVGINLEDLCKFFERSLGGKALTSQIPVALEWLTNPTNSLAYLDDLQKYKITRLGAAALRGTLPLDFAAAFAQLLRDLIYLDLEGKLLSNWRPLDHLITLELLSPQPIGLRRFSKKIVEQTDGFFEKSPDCHSLLFSNWIRGNQCYSRAAELAGSLNMTNNNPSNQKPSPAVIYQQVYLAAFRAAVLYERAQGTSIEQVQRKWSVDSLEDIEQRWRDTNLWLLSGISEILDLRCFYHHLKEECAASQQRTQQTKKALSTMRDQVLLLLNLLKYCSPLGSFLFQMRGYYKNKAHTNVGHLSIRRLENAGITSLQHLSTLQEKDLIEIGLNRNAAAQISKYLQTRRQF